MQQCWVTSSVFLRDVRKWIVSSDNHEISFHDMNTLSILCRLQLPATVMSMDYFREENKDIGHRSTFVETNSLPQIPTTGLPAGSGSSPTGATASQYVTNEGVLFLGDNQGEITIAYMNPEHIFDASSPVMIAAAKGQTYSLSLTDRSMFSMVIKKRLHGDWVMRIHYFHEFRCFFSCSPDSKNSLVCGIVNQKKWRFSSASVNKGINAFAVCRFPVALITVGADRKVRLWNPYIYFNLTEC